MSTIMQIGVAVVIGSILLSRALTSSAVRGLDTEQNSAYLQTLGSMRNIYFLWIAGLALVFMGTWHSPWGRGPVAFTAAWSVLTVGLALIYALTVRRLRHAAVPSAFVQRYLLSRVVSLLGVVSLFAAIVAESWIR